jgi:hypothetical protein
MHPVTVLSVRGGGGCKVLSQKKELTLYSQVWVDCDDRMHGEWVGEGEREECTPQVWVDCDGRMHGEWVGEECVCVCVCVRERERERESNVPPSAG